MSKSGNDNVGEAFRDNVVLEYAGIPASALTPAQQEQLTDLVDEYVRNMREGHAAVRMKEVQTEPDSVFYYRIHSPVILVEFDHQRPAGLRHVVSDPSAPEREHIHTVVRTPNGNDDGTDLLRHHYQQHPHPHTHWSGALATSESCRGRRRTRAAVEEHP